MVCIVLFSILSSFDLRNCIFQSAKKCAITLSMTSLHVDQNEPAKCVHIISFTLLASFLSCLCTLLQNTKEDDIWPNLSLVSIKSQSVAKCRRVSQHFSTAVSIRRKVLQNQNSATLCDTCDTLGHFAI